MKDSWIVFKKELIDALRDRKTLATLLLSVVLIVPLMPLIISMVIAEKETRAERREVWVAGGERAPELGNFLRRQGMTVHEAPSDYEARLHEFSFGEAVIVVPEDFSEKQARGEAPELRVVFDSANNQSEMLVKLNTGLLRAFAGEQGKLELALRGVSPAVLEPYVVQVRNLADEQSQSAQFTGMLAWIFIMAVLAGSMAVALDTTAGERERASLEPLLTNPIHHLSLILGKWMAVAAVAMSIALLSVLCVFPSRWLIRSEALLAMFHFGPTESVLFLLMLLPFAGAVAAVLMFAAIHGRSYKEAQARATLAMLAFQFAPLLAIVDFSGEKPWHLWIPGLAQQTVMLRVLRGDALHWQHVAIPTVVSISIAIGCLYALARRLKVLALK